jgi:hypothetical protein
MEPDAEDVNSSPQEKFEKPRVQHFEGKNALHGNMEIDLHFASVDSGATNTDQALHVQELSAVASVLAAVTATSTNNDQSVDAFQGPGNVSMEDAEFSSAAKSAEIALRPVPTVENTESFDGRLDSRNAPVIGRTEVIDHASWPAPGTLVEPALRQIRAIHERDSSGRNRNNDMQGDPMTGVRDFRASNTPDRRVQHSDRQHVVRAGLSKPEAPKPVTVQRFNEDPKESGLFGRKPMPRVPPKALRRRVKNHFGRQRTQKGDRSREAPFETILNRPTAMTLVERDSGSQRKRKVDRSDIARLLEAKLKQEYHRACTADPRVGAAIHGWAFDYVFAVPKVDNAGIVKIENRIRGKLRLHPIVLKYHG